MPSIPAGGMHGASHEVLGRLAVGGMAEIYLARTTHGDGRREIVVLKRILPHLSEDPEFVRMFRDEAYLAATLDHPNIVRVHDIGQDGEDYFFTMEYVHGENVRTIIKAAQKVEMDIPLQHVVQIALGVCEGLHYAHEQVDEDGTPLRIVHRDVSPTNILVSFDGAVKIVDFGIAKAAAATHVTQAGMLKGKASYMSPEQCRAEPVDRRSDVFAIGILIYEMTTLTRLFRGDNELAVLHQILTGTVEAPSTRVDDYPADLEHIVMKALAQRPDDRYPTALDMRDDLERFARQRHLMPSDEALGDYLRDLCGERPNPWGEEEDEGYEDEGYEDDALEAGEQSGTGMPTTLGNFEDEEDTQVNRRAPDLRTMVPGAPSGWSDREAGGPEEATGATSRRAAPGGPSSPATGPADGGSTMGPRGAASRATPGASSRAGARPELGGRLRLPSRGMPPRRPSSTDETVPVPGSDDEELELDSHQATTPMTKPAEAMRPTRRGPAPRPARPTSGLASSPPFSSSSPTRKDDRAGPVAQPFGTPQPFAARSGGTLTGPGGGLGGPAPARSGRTLPGGGPSSPSSPAGLGGGTERTMSAGAGSRPLVPTSQVRPGRRPGSVATPMPTSSGPSPSDDQAPSAADRTMALTPEQARAMAQAGGAASPPGPTPSVGSTPSPSPGPSPWSGPGVGRTEIAPIVLPAAPPADPRAEVDEGARTVAMPRFDRTMLASATDRDLPESWPQGPMGWGQTPPSSDSNVSPIASLTSTQKSPIPSLTATQRTPSHPEAPLVGVSAPPGSELRRPEMRSPSPRPAGTPRSLWVPVLIVLIVGLAGTAVWLWLTGPGR